MLRKRNIKPNKGDEGRIDTLPLLFKPKGMSDRGTVSWSMQHEYDGVALTMKVSDRQPLQATRNYPIMQTKNSSSGDLMLKSKTRSEASDNAKNIESQVRERRSSKAIFSTIIAKNPVHDGKVSATKKVYKKKTGLKALPGDIDPTDDVNWETLHSENTIDSRSEKETKENVPTESKMTLSDIIDETIFNNLQQDHIRDKRFTCEQENDKDIPVENEVNYNDIISEAVSLRLKSSKAKKKKLKKKTKFIESSSEEMDSIVFGAESLKSSEQDYYNDATNGMLNLSSRSKFKLSDLAILVGKTEGFDNNREHAKISEESHQDNTMSDGMMEPHLKILDTNRSESLDLYQYQNPDDNVPNSISTISSFNPSKCEDDENHNVAKPSKVDNQYGTFLGKKVVHQVSEKEPSNNENIPINSLGSICLLNVNGDKTDPSTRLKNGLQIACRQCLVVDSAIEINNVILEDIDKKEEMSLWIVTTQSQMETNQTSAKTDKSQLIRLIIVSDFR